AGGADAGGLPARGFAPCGDPGGSAGRRADAAGGGGAAGGRLAGDDGALGRRTGRRVGGGSGGRGAGLEHGGRSPMTRMRLTVVAALATLLASLGLHPLFE